MTESTSEYWMTTVDDEVHKVNEVLTSSAKAGWELVTTTASQWGETDGRGAVTEHTTYAIDDGQTALILVGESKIEAPSRTQASSPASSPSTLTSARGTSTRPSRRPPAGSAEHEILFVSSHRVEVHRAESR